MMRIFIIGIVLLLNASQVCAQTIYGPGNKPCSDLVKAWEGGSFFDKNFFDAWVTGFVVGANWASQQAVQADETAFGMALLKFCKINLSVKVVEGVIQVYEDLN